MKISNKKLSLWFEPKEIDDANIDEKTWLKFIREREAKFIFSLFGNHKFKSALELGAGDGEQSITIAKFCNKLTCTEIDQNKLKPRNIPHTKYQICDAEDLSRFPDNSFDLIFSSNMLEHLHNPQRCLKECKRVIKKRGIIIATVPNRTWKFFNFCFAPLRGIIPKIHGVSSNHFIEFKQFGSRRWEKEFKDTGFNIIKKIKLPFYIGHGNRFITLIKLGNKIHISASTCFILNPD